MRFCMLLFQSLDGGNQTEQQVERAMSRMIDYYAASDPTQIAHTLCVHEYTRLLARREGYDEHKVGLLEIAAIMHDIGCPSAKWKYGNSQPAHQQQEGMCIAAEWFASDPSWLDTQEAQWIVDVVGAHHNAVKAETLGFEVLYEADLIVNLFEGYYPVDYANVYYHKMVRTESGKQLFRQLFARWLKKD